MTSEANEILGAILNGWNQKDWGILEDVHAADWVDHSAPAGMNGLAAMKKFFDEFTGSFPDMEMVILHSFVKDDEVAYYYAIRGTQEKEIWDIPEKGKRADFTGMMMLKIASGKCVEAWGVTDKMLLFHQLR